MSDTGHTAGGDYFEDAETVFGDDPARAAGLADLAGVLRGAHTRPWPATLEGLAGFVREQRAAHAAAEPIIPAAEGLAAVLADVATRHAQRQATGSDILGHRTGFPKLDRILGGLERGRLGVLLAGPGTGKTNLSNQLAGTVAAAGAPVLFVTYENGPDDLLLKQLARIAGVSPSAARRGGVDPAQLAAAAGTFRAAGGDRLYYLAGTAATTLETIRGALERITRRHPDAGYPLLIVDYLQKLSTTATPAGRGAGLDDMRGKVGAAMQGLRDLATETGAHVWAISSVSRGSSGGNGKGNNYQAPHLAAAKESGDVEFGSDYVLSLAKGDASLTSSVSVDPLTLTVEKNRHGGDTGSWVPLGRDRLTLRVAELETGPKITFADQARAGWKSA